MYLIYNEDGSIKAKNLNTFIIQGNSYVNFIQIAIENRNPEDYLLEAHFELENGTKENVFLSETTTIHYNGVDYPGRSLSLSKLETALSGKLKMNIQAIENNTDSVLTTYTVFLSVNSGVNPGELAFMSQEEYQNLINTTASGASKEYVDIKLAEKVDKVSGESLVPDAKVAAYDAHLLDTNNPHEVTKSQVGLGSVVNTGDSDTPTENGTTKFTTGGAWALDQRVSALENIGRFLSLWNATDGVAVSNPPTSPYTYKNGDYFRISISGNKIPTGSSYTIGGINYTTYAGTLQVGDVVYYDGTNWVVQAGSGQGNVADVKVNGNSVVVSGTANITVPAYYKHTISITISNISIGTFSGGSSFSPNGNEIRVDFEHYSKSNTPINTLQLLLDNFEDDNIYVIYGVTGTNIGEYTKRTAIIGSIRMDEYPSGTGHIRFVINRCISLENDTLFDGCRGYVSELENVSGLTIYDAVTEVA